MRSNRPFAFLCRAAVLAVYAAEALLLAFALKLKVAAAGREAGGGRSVRSGLGTAGYGFDADYGVLVASSQSGRCSAAIKAENCVQQE